MNSVTIKKGTHAPFSFPKLFVKDMRLQYDITFTKSCAYDIGPEDQGDINKLYGVGYYTTKIFKKKEVKLPFSSKKTTIPWFRPMHHYNSVRFGWRYDIKTSMIEILGYWYERGIRHEEHIAWTQLDRTYRYSFHIFLDCHLLTVYSKENGYEEVGELYLPIPGSDTGYPLRPYFGGNQKAPHDMTIKIENIR